MRPPLSSRRSGPGAELQTRPRGLGSCCAGGSTTLVEMSGAIFTPLEGLGALDTASGHPLVCPLCHAQYERPCLLECFHDFCAGCLRGRAVDGRLACPLCHPQSARALGLNQRWPPGRRDHVLLQHLRATPVCALPRRDAPGTHVRAPRYCGPRPAQPRRDPEVQESRAHCVDLESAYVQGCERLEQAVLAVKALQTATREAIALLQVMVEEVRRSAAEEDAAIHTLFGSMQDKLAERKALLLQAVQSQYDEKDKAFKEQLSHLAALLPTLQVHLVICSSFLSLANKAEFLDLGYELMERLQSIVTGPHRLRPAQSSKIASDHHAEFARCLEPLLLLGPRRAASAANTLAGGAGPKVLMGPRCPSPVRKTPGSPVQKPTLHRSIGTKVLLAEGKDTPFTEHCRHYEDAYRGLQAEVQNLKDQVQELHRDLTRHHSLIKAEIMGDILSRSLRLDARISSEYSSAEGMRAIFQEIWEESYQRVANEQEVYEAQLHDLLQLKQENAYLTTITKQITPYVRSIAKVKERLEPRFQLPVDEQSETLQSTYDGSRSSETLARNDPGSAVEKGEKTSESKGNSRALSGVSEDPPLKNREHLRSKQKNGDDLPTCREQPT
ncbi:RING finger protein 207 isoform 4-T4 [Callospermophilus lateralis]|uniref:RING finger protein 207 isoform X7 n=1 Tax=Callospermophilus lateralis TaxID=76772 RepID=UPI0040544640